MSGFGPSKTCSICGVEYQTEGGKQPDCPNLHSAEEQALHSLRTEVARLTEAAILNKGQQILAEIERDRYKAALERIAKKEHDIGCSSWLGMGGNPCSCPVVIAQSALKGVEP